MGRVNDNSAEKSRFIKLNQWVRSWRERQQRPTCTISDTKIKSNREGKKWNAYTTKQ